MSRLKKLLVSLLDQPGYTLMRGFARFVLLRNMAAKIRGYAHLMRTKISLEEYEKNLKKSIFTNVDRVEFVRHLRDEGVAFGLKLPLTVVDEIRQWAESQNCYADRDPMQGFRLQDVAAAETKLGKPILLAQYFNTTTKCSAIDRLAQDPMLLWIATSFLGSSPTFVGANLWWTFPVKALEEDREKHAHVYHQDLDDFRFFKFFFYLTDVAPNEGAHVCVICSHKNPPRLKIGDPWNIRRYTDAEIDETYPSELIQEICGDAGVGFAENTLCIHKGSTPKKDARLLLQLQFALFDYGVMHDQRSEAKLSNIVLATTL